MCYVALTDLRDGMGDSAHSMEALIHLCITLLRESLDFFSGNLSCNLFKMHSMKELTKIADAEFDWNLLKLGQACP